MIPIPGRHRVPLPPPVHRGSFLDIVALVESQKAHEKKIQAKIDKLSTAYYWIYCDIEAQNIRQAILALEGEKYKLHSETNNYLYEVTKHHQRTEHIVFANPEARLKADSFRASAINSIIAVNEDKLQPNPTQPIFHRALAIDARIAAEAEVVLTLPRQE